MFRFLLFIIFVFFNFNTHSWAKWALLDESGVYSIQFGASASSHQFILSKTETSSQFKNKLTESGSWVLNPVLNLSHTVIKEEHYKKQALLLFSDCLALPSFGYAFSMGKQLSEKTNSGLW